MRAHHRFLLRERLRMVDSLERAISRLDHEIEERLRPLEETMQRLDAITGVRKPRAGNALCRDRLGAGCLS